MQLKYTPLIWSGITRQPGRTVLTLLQVAVACALFATLQGVKIGAQSAIASSRADLLDVRPAVYGSGPLPLAYLSRLRSLPDVKMAVLLNGFSATFQNPNQHIYALALDPERLWLEVAPEIFKIPPEDLMALAAHRNGALVSRATLEKYGWKVGTQIPLMASDTPQATGSPYWTFDIAGTYELHQVGGSPGDLIVINNSYLNEARASNKSTADHFLVVSASASQAKAVANEIDQGFANSAHSTRTESYRDGAEREMRSIGDLDFVIRAVVGAVLAALLLSTVTMMMQSVRDRTRELAMLKAIGYTSSRIVNLVLAEAILIFLAAAALGLGLATTAFPFAATLVPGVSMPPVVIAVSIGGAVFLALVSACLPATLAARLPVAEALGRN